MRIAIHSTMGGLPWGGSEELWQRAAMALLARGHEVAFSTVKWKPTPAPLDRLIAAGGVPHFRRKSKIGRTVRRKLERANLLRPHSAKWLTRTRPDLVLINLSCHTDDPQIAVTCRKLGIRYAILLQAASPYLWVADRWLDDTWADFTGAERCYFVSAENREIMEANLAAAIPQAEVVDNPFNVRIDAAPRWPASEPKWKLACVARLHFISKSQDILLQVMSQPKWRTRPLEITMWGSDQGSRQHIERLIDFYRLKGQVSYGGFANDIEALWSQHHGLILPSRLEGNPLSMIEAMMCGRVPIVTNVGRAAELVDDNESGFIAPAATVALVDAALERAWQRRDEWQAMGQRAARAIRDRHSLHPAEEFADRLLAAAGKNDAALRAAA
jgi:glycosyltransferase involved in cell wall biosynthesis